MSDSVNTVIVCSSHFIDSMSVNCEVLDGIIDGRVIEVVEDAEGIMRPFLDDDRTNGPVTVDTNDRTTNPIGTSFYPRYIPVNDLGGC